MESQSYDEVYFGGSPNLSRKTSEAFISKPNQFLQALQITTTLNLQYNTKECRFCLDNFQTPQNKLVAPCKCSGSLKYVHNDCFIRWIAKLYKNKPINQKNEKFINCQLCQQKIILVFDRRYQCCSKQAISLNYHRNVIVFYVYLMFLCLNLGSICYLAYFVSQNPINFNTKLTSSIIMICALILLCITALYILFNFTFYFLAQQIKIITSFKAKQQKNNSKRSLLKRHLKVMPEIHPISRH